MTTKEIKNRKKDDVHKDLAEIRILIAVLQEQVRQLSARLGMGIMTQEDIRELAAMGKKR